MREVRDSLGRQWVVWEVKANMHRPRHGVERRRIPRPAIERGWLVCRCDAIRERRRLSDYPTEWRTLPDDALLRLCMRAPVVPAAPRLIE